METGASAVPDTFTGADPVKLINKLVRVRPYYHGIVQDESGRFERDGESKRYPWAVMATVQEPYGKDGVVLRFTDTEGPWEMLGAYRVGELHSLVCKCPACMGDGIHELRGA